MREVSKDQIGSQDQQEENSMQQSEIEQGCDGSIELKQSVLPQVSKCLYICFKFKRNFIHYILFYFTDKSLWLLAAHKISITQNLKTPKESFNTYGNAVSSELTNLPLNFQTPDPSERDGKV